MLQDEKTIYVFNSVGEMFNQLDKLWSISKNQLFEEDTEIFQEKKPFEAAYNNIKAELIKSKMKYVFDGPYFSDLESIFNYQRILKKEFFLLLILSQMELLVIQLLMLKNSVINTGRKTQINIKKLNKIKVKDGKKSIQINDVLTFSAFGKFNKNKVLNYLKDLQFVLF